MDRTILVIGIVLFAVWLVLNIVDAALGVFMWILLAVALTVLAIAAGRYIEHARRPAR